MPVIFEFGYEDLFNNDEWVTIGSFTYGGTLNSTSADSFYEPNNSRSTPSKTIDYFIYYEEDKEKGTSRLRYMTDNLGELRPPGGGTGYARFLDEFFGDETWVMPYEFDAVCDIDPTAASGCLDVDEEEQVFITPQVSLGSGVSPA